MKNVNVAQAVAEPQKPPVLEDVRLKIAEMLEAGNYKQKAVLTNLDMNLAACAPSVVTEGFAIADYPFVAAAYFSIEDGYIYVVRDTANEGTLIVAQQMTLFGFLFIKSPKAFAVGITGDAWIRSRMAMISIVSPKFGFDNGALESIGDNQHSIMVSRICAAYWQHKKEVIIGLFRSFISTTPKQP